MKSTALALSIGVRGLEFRAGSAPPPRVADRLNLVVPNHEEAPVGWFSFEVQRPGSQAFARRAVTIAEGNLSRAARLLGINRASIYRWQERRAPRRA